MLRIPAHEKAAVAVRTAKIVFTSSINSEYSAHLQYVDNRRMYAPQTSFVFGEEGATGQALLQKRFDR